MRSQCARILELPLHAAFTKFPIIRLKNTNNSNQEPNNELSPFLLSTKLWASLFDRSVWKSIVGIQITVRIDWPMSILQQEGYGLPSFSHVMSAHLCKFISIILSGRICSLETSLASKNAG
jgi:hypothetical protein